MWGLPPPPPPPALPLRLLPLRPPLRPPCVAGPTPGRAAPPHAVPLIPRLPAAAPAPRVRPAGKLAPGERAAAAQACIDAMAANLHQATNDINMSTFFHR